MIYLTEDDSIQMFENRGFFIMVYAKMLDEIIRKSGLSLRQLTKRCGDLNYEITPSYISQLKNGKLPPPSEDISKALAFVCGEKNPMRLVFQGYLEKAPEVIRKYILMSVAVNKHLLKSISQDKEVGAKFEEYIDELEVLAALDLSAKLIQSINESDVNALIAEINTMSGAVHSIEEENSENAYFFLRDGSMDPLIPMNAHVKITPTRTELLKNRDVVAFYPKDNKSPCIRRYFEQNSSIILVPENKDYDIFCFDDMTNFNYLGKVISFKMNF